jgi:molybdopterin-guanine dinucleotide biosynthesis protein A
MIEAVISTLAKVCRRVVVVGGIAGGFPSVADRRPGAGPLGGIEALLASGIDDEYLVCPNDTPLITPALLRRLQVPGTSLATIFEIEGESRIQSLPLRISANALGAITAALDAGRNSIHRVLTEIEVSRVPITVRQARALLNINTPGEYAALVQQWEITD